MKTLFATARLGRVRRATRGRGAPSERSGFGAIPIGAIEHDGPRWTTIRVHGRSTTFDMLNECGRLLVIQPPQRRFASRTGRKSPVVVGLDRMADVAAEQVIRRPGRARLFPPDEERTLLLDAAMNVLRWNDYADAPILEILEEAGLSTRAFYRHFESKDHLLLALHRREAESVAQRLESRVAEANTPTEGLRIWVEITVSRRTRRSAILSSEGIRRAKGWAEEASYALDLMAKPLLTVLKAGRRDGSFPAATPESDVQLIQAMVWPRSGLIPGLRSPVPDHIVTFCLRALGATER